MVLLTTPYCKISQRERNELKNGQFITTKLAEEFNGFVNTLATFGRFVELDNYFVRDARPLGAAPIAAGGN
jgi:exoribonuclease R